MRYATLAPDWVTGARWNPPFPGTFDVEANTSEVTLRTIAQFSIIRTPGIKADSKMHRTRPPVRVPDFRVSQSPEAYRKCLLQRLRRRKSSKVEFRPHGIDDRFVPWPKSIDLVFQFPLSQPPQIWERAPNRKCGSDELEIPSYE